MCFIVSTQTTPMEDCDVHLMERRLSEMEARFAAIDKRCSKIEERLATVEEERARNWNDVWTERDDALLSPNLASSSARCVATTDPHRISWDLATTVVDTITATTKSVGIGSTDLASANLVIRNVLERIKL
jgi:hypothetical protein